MPRRLLKRRTPLPPVMAAIDTFKELEAMAEEQVEALELQIIKHPAFALGVSPRALTRPPVRSARFPDALHPPIPRRRLARRSGRT